MGEQLPRDFQRVRPPLEGALVRLRAVEESDLRRIHEMFNDPEVLHFLEVVTFPQPMAGTVDWWTISRKDPSSLHLTIETVSGELVGAIGLRGVNGRTRAATLGLWIGKPYWDHGYGTDAVRTVCRFAFREMNLRRVELHVHESNPRGKRAYEKVGFKEEGRLRRAHFSGGHPIDSIVMGLLAEELTEG